MIFVCTRLRLWFSMAQGEKNKMDKVHLFVCVSSIFLLLVAISSLKNIRETIGEKRPQSTVPACGKICSYDWDYRENATFWPLLNKAVNCRNTLYRMAYSPYPVIRPPPRRPPKNLLKDFTMNGRCPITLYQYYDESTSTKKGFSINITAEHFRRLLAQDRVKNINSYQDKNVLKPTLTKYIHTVKGKHVAVIGTQNPWAEAILLNLGARHVTTVEYTKLIIDDDRVTTITPYELAKQFLGGRATPFDTVFTYSSLEHSGLGRYGDPLTPFGDLEAAAQVWCMVKPAGHFILAVPESAKRRNNCFIVWNAHRVYGASRLQHLMANWRVLDAVNALDYYTHGIYVLQKMNIAQFGAKT